MQQGLELRGCQHGNKDVGQFEQAEVIRIPHYDSGAAGEVLIGILIVGMGFEQQGHIGDLLYGLDK